MTEIRPTFQDLGLCAGRRKHLHDLMYAHGPGNGTLMILPIDQGLEHGPVDFFVNPDAAHPLFQFELALQGGFSGIATHIGLADKYYTKYAGKVPLVLKLNGKTSIPSDDEAFSSCTGTVQDALRLGASAVGYTLFVGSPRQDEDIAQLREIREEAHAHGLPLIVWAYPRGKDVEKKGGKQSLYAIAYAARVAHELGADVVKVNFPEGVNQYCPEPYKNLDWDQAAQDKHVISSGGHSYIIFSGGSKISNEELLNRVRTGMSQGGSGVIFGRNFWQRPFNDACALAHDVREILREHGQDLH